MGIAIVLTQPDGTPLTEKDSPAPGTLLVVEATGNSTGKVIGWVPGGGDKMARSLLTGACKALNSRVAATGEPEGD